MALSIFFGTTGILFGYEGTTEAKKTFAFEIGYVGLWRSPLKHLDFLFVGDGILIDNPVITRIPYDYTSGGRAQLEFMGGQKNSLELIYSGLFHWRSSESRTSATSNFSVPTTPYTNVDWTDFDYFHYSYHSELNSGELSYWRHVTPRYVDYFSFSWLLGLRYIDLRDTLKMSNGSGTSGDNAHVHAINQMGGAQVGLEFQANATSRLTWAVQVKGGAYANFAQKKTVFYDLDGSELLVSSHPSKVEKSYTLELIPYILYRLNPIYFKIAYDRSILFNPVLAPTQPKFPKSVHNIYTHSYVNFQALYASIGFYW